MKFTDLTWNFTILLSIFTASCIYKDKSIINKYESNLIKLKEGKTYPTHSQIIASIQSDLNLDDADIKLVYSTDWGIFNENYESYDIKKDNIKFNIGLEGEFFQIHDKDYPDSTVVKKRVYKITVSYPDGRKFNCDYNRANCKIP